MFFPHLRGHFPLKKTKIPTGREGIVFETSAPTQLPQKLGGSRDVRERWLGLSAEGTDLWAEPEPRALGLGVFFSFGQLSLLKVQVNF